MEDRPGAHDRGVQKGSSPDLDELLPLRLGQRIGSLSDENIRGDEIVDAVLIVGLQLQRLLPGAARAARLSRRPRHPRHISCIFAGIVEEFHNVDVAMLARISSVIRSARCEPAARVPLQRECLRRRAASLPCNRLGPEDR